jgi:hypothetical protein
MRASSTRASQRRAFFISFSTSTSLRTEAYSTFSWLSMSLTPMIPLATLAASSLSCQDDNAVGGGHNDFIGRRGRIFHQGIVDRIADSPVGQGLVSLNRGSGKKQK